MRRGVVVLLAVWVGCSSESSGPGGSGGGAAGAGGASCTGVTGPCLLDQGSTRFEDVRVEEGALPNFMVDILLAKGGAAAGETLDVAFLNAGAMRAGTNSGPPDFTWTSETARIGATFGPGPVSAADVRGWMPFQDDHVVMTITGAQLKRSLESGVRTWADDAGLRFGPDLVADKGGELLHVAGMKYQVTCPGTTRIEVGPAECSPAMDTCAYRNADAASSVSRIEVGGTVLYDAAMGGWQGNGADRPLRVIMNSFLALGLDYHLDFKQGTDRKTIARSTFDYVEVVLAELQARSPLMLGGKQGRISVVGKTGDVACNLPATCLPAHRDHPNCAHLR